jgi:hypothetical protein
VWNVSVQNYSLLAWLQFQIWRCSCTLICTCDKPNKLAAAASIYIQEDCGPNPGSTPLILTETFIILLCLSRNISILFLKLEHNHLFPQTAAQFTDYLMFYTTCSD